MAQRLPHPLYRAIRKQRVRRAIRGYPQHLHTGTYGGHELTLRLQDPLAEGWYGHDWPVLPEIELLEDRLDEARVFDLGAHQGVVALMLARRAQEVLAVEAEPHNARAAEDNRHLNDAENLTVVNAAIDEVPGTVDFAVGLNGQIGSTRFGSERVEAQTIDSLAVTYGMPDVVFIDIEGHEGRALRGAQKVIASGAAFFIEVHVGRLVDSTAEQIVGAFTDRELLVAEEPGGDKATHSFEPLTGLPRERFYLLVR